MFKNVIEKINGYKTYILAIGLVLYAVGGVLTGHLTIDQAVELLFGSGFMVTLRSALKKIE